MMSDLTAVVLAQADGATPNLWVILGTVVASLLAAMTWFGKWVTGAFSRNLDQHALQIKERDAQHASQIKDRDTFFAAQMDKRDASFARMAESYDDYTKIVCTLVLEINRGSEASRETAEDTIKRIDRRRDHHGAA